MNRIWTELVLNVAGRCRGALTVLPVLLLVAGCGGGGGAATPPSVQLTGTLTVTPETVNPGEAVTVTWTSANADFEVDDNFYTESAGHVPQLSGSVTFHPTTSETYQISFQRNAQLGDPVQQLELTAKVTVRKTTEKYLVIATSGEPGVVALVNALKTVTTTPVTIELDMPPYDPTVDCLVLDYTGHFEPPDTSIVLDYLSHGKGVVLVRAAPRLLGVNNFNNNDDDNIVTIQSWFGAGPGLNNCQGNAHARAGSYVPIPATLINSRRPGIGPTFSMKQVNPGVDVICKGDTPIGDNNFIIAFGNRPSIGGRVYYQPNTTFQDDPLLLAAGARWAATGP